MAKASINTTRTLRQRMTIGLLMCSAPLAIAAILKCHSLRVDWKNERAALIECSSTDATFGTRNPFRRIAGNFGLGCQATEVELGSPSALQCFLKHRSSFKDVSFVGLDDVPLSKEIIRSIRNGSNSGVSISCSISLPDHALLDHYGALGENDRLLFDGDWVSDKDVEDLLQIPAGVFVMINSRQLSEKTVERAKAMRPTEFVFRYSGAASQN